MLVVPLQCLLACAFLFQVRADQQGGEDGDESQSAKGETGEQEEGADEASRQPDASEQNGEQSEDQAREAAGQQDQERAADTTGDEEQTGERADEQSQEGNDEAQSVAGAEPLDSEEQRAAEQWLRRIPDDPAGLLRRKFLYQYNQRAGKSDPGGSQTW